MQGIGSATASKQHLPRLLSNYEQHRVTPVPSSKRLDTDGDDSHKIVRLAPKENPNECTCPEIVEEKIRPSTKELLDQNDPTAANRAPKFNRYMRGKFLGKGGFAQCYEVTKIHSDDDDEQNTVGNRR